MRKDRSWGTPCWPQTPLDVKRRIVRLAGVFSGRSKLVASGNLIQVFHQKATKPAWNKNSSSLENPRHGEADDVGLFIDAGHLAVVFAGEGIGGEELIDHLSGGGVRHDGEGVDVGGG